MRKRDAHQESRTHFEQISVEEVKKVAVRDVLTEPEAGTGNLVIEPVSHKTEPYSVRPDWFWAKRH